MKKLWLIAAVLLIVSIQLKIQAAFYPKQNDTTDNTLSQTEKAQGWKLLFDDKTMNGWRTYQNKPQTAWYISNSVLACKYDISHTYQHTDLITEKQYKNFELAVDCKVDPRANGVFYVWSTKNTNILFTVDQNTNCWMIIGT